MDNTEIIHLNNSAVDALHAGFIEKGFGILSQAFAITTIRNRHVHHRLGSKTAAASLEFSLQDCSRNIERILQKRPRAGHDASQFLCLNLLRLQIPSNESGSPEEAARHADGVNQMCSCSVAWALGFNLSLVYAVMGFQTGSRTYFKKAMRILVPIKRQVLLQTSQSAFWINLKLCILNNYTCLLQELLNNENITTGATSVSVEVMRAVHAMGQLLKFSRPLVDPADVRKYYLSMQFLNTPTCMAAAA